MKFMLMSQMFNNGNNSFGNSTNGMNPMMMMMFMMNGGAGNMFDEMLDFNFDEVTEEKEEK